MEIPFGGLSIVCRVKTRLCALPVVHVVETMRPLPVEPMAGAPDFVMGLAIIRGGPVPVIDVACLLGTDASCITRFVTVRAGARLVALAVDAVEGVRSIPAEMFQELPPLLLDAHRDVVVMIGSLDQSLALVLHSARLVPETVWTRLDEAVTA